MSKQVVTRSSKNNSKKRKSKSKSKKTSTFKNFIFKSIISLFVLGCIGLIAGMGLFWYYAKDAPTLSDQKLDATGSSKLYASNGEIFQDIGAETREKIAPNEIPKLLEEAIISVEDRRFYRHLGIDPIRIAGSALRNITTGSKQGGSTLTQQLIKLSYFSTNASDQTLRRKAQEAYLAVQLEREKSKQEILTYYINKVYMSNGYYGMETASQAFYGKSLAELDLPQTALLAGLPNAPSDFDPYAHPKNAKARRDIVLYTMLTNDKITESEYENAVNTPIDEGLLPPQQKDNSWKYYDNYIKEVIDEVKEKTGKDAYTDSLEIYTNLDPKVQKHLYKIVNSDEYVNYPDKEMQVAATLIDVNNGNVIAQIGGRNIPEGTVLGWNRAVNTTRDFGSTVKPVTDYAPAFEYLNYSTGKIINDEPYKFEGTDISVQNWDRSYMGAMTLRRALALSRNVPAVKLFNEVGKSDIKEFLDGVGIRYSELEQANAISSNTSLQEGTKYGISSLKLAAAYAAFANGGTYYEPRYVNKVVFEDGTEDATSFEEHGSQAMQSETAYMITDILKDVISSGTGTNAMIPGVFQAGKTGTSNYTDDELEQISSPYSVSPDATFAGYTPFYSLAIWTGYDKKLTPVTDLSSHVATDVYRELMKYLVELVGNKDWTMPNGLVRVGSELYFKNKYEPEVKTSQTTEETSESSEEETSETISSETETTTETTETSGQLPPPIPTESSDTTPAEPDPGDNN